nr:wall-associated kinase-like protein [Brassica napus]
MLSASKSCSSHCGGIHIPYPFGIGEGCYLNKWYEIKCDHNTSLSVSGKPVPVLSLIGKEVVKISLPDTLDTSGSDRAPYGSVRIKYPITSKGCSSNEQESTSHLNLTGSPLYVAVSNTLIAIGCDNRASLTNVEPVLVGCFSSCLEPNPTASVRDYLATVNCNSKSGSDYGYCSERSYRNGTSCNGNRCCEASIPSSIQQAVGVIIDANSTTTRGCKVAFLTDEAYSLLNETDPNLVLAKRYSTVELGWFIHTTNLSSFVDYLRCMPMREYLNLRSSEHSYRLTYGISCVCDYNSYFPNYASCRCNSGYSGNPYIPDGCKDINECTEKDSNCGDDATCINLLGSYQCINGNHWPLSIGIGSSLSSLIFVGGIYGLYKLIRKQRRLSNQKKKFFKRNGGLLLQQQLTSTDGNIEKTILFSSRELKQATENFSLTRVLGQGGQGTVYKGILVDGRVVAVKKSKVVDEDKLEEFINEVVILSQINHRNIVKLLGCCLETDVPVLVYEFIPNGNLFEHLHDELVDQTMTIWELRLRIAIDTAAALSYLHSAASFPIYHRDIKSTNIMLDERYGAKISDFGTSRTVTVDHTHLTTVVSGTVGYLDPEYFQSNQFTDKSDVYSFGVVLVELITGEKSVSFLRSQENRILATYFILAMKENRLFDIIDARIRDSCMWNQVTAMANIARKCLSRKGRQRPSMREVSMELEKIRASSVDMELHEYGSENEEDHEDRVVDANIELQSWNNVAVTAPTSQYDVGTSSLSMSDVEPLFPFQTR